MRGFGPALGGLLKKQIYVRGIGPFCYLDPNQAELAHHVTFMSGCQPMLLVMKRDTWLFRISLVWIAILLAIIPFAMYVMY